MFGATATGWVITLAAAGAALAGVEPTVITKTETTLLNVPLSMLYMGIAGTMIGLFLMPAKDMARVKARDGASPKNKVAFLLLTAAVLGAIVLSYSFIAAWAVQILTALVLGITRFPMGESLTMPATAVVGIGIRGWLPGLMGALQRRAERLIGGDS